MDVTRSRNSTWADDFFTRSFSALTNHPPMRWQTRLFRTHFMSGDLPEAVSIPTGLGKTAVMAVWLIGLAWQMQNNAARCLPRRLVYVVDRRAVVDQSTTFAEMLRKNLGAPDASELRAALGFAEGQKFAISTLRGQYVDNREWLEDPSRPAIIVGTVDMIGSRLLFEGYGVSRKMRPYHAGLLGADALVLLDEAHLVPPFESLLAEIAGNPEQYGPKVNEGRTVIPKFQLLPLSATGRRQTAQAFVLEESDFDKNKETVAHERLFARKRLMLKEPGKQALEVALAESAWALSDGGKKPVRVIVYCNERNVAEKAKAALDGLVKKGKGSPAASRIELFVGARRVKERMDAEQRLRELGFLAGSGEQNAPAFLVATSAGEVGVDLDADHMVCDLVAWERMVQRLGRVNRRGGSNRLAEIKVIDEGVPKPKKPEQPTADDKMCIRVYHGVKKLLTELRSGGTDEFSVNPEALRQLNERATRDDGLSRLIADACSPAPLRPALNRALVDAWSMTSLPEHTGRPEVEPWLRGWVDDDSQTTVAWRKHLPVRPGAPASKQEIEEFFEAAPLHVSETLETESYRVMEWLQARAAKLDKFPEGEKALKAGDVVAILLKMDGSLAQALKLGDLLGASKEGKRRHEDIRRNLYGKTLVMDARFGGLYAGLLKNEASDAPATADGDEAWSAKGEKAWIISNDATPIIRFRILEQSPDAGETAENDWRENLRFDLERSADDETTRWLSIQKWRDTSNTANDRAEGRPQSLVEHQSCTAERAKIIGKRLGLPEEYIQVLVIAARLHDEGKKGRNWKRAFHVERYARELGIPGQPLAKTPKFTQRFLEGYRHEFGSLPYAKDDAEFKRLSSDMQDLVLHLIAAHHGFARPLIATKGCEDAPPSMLEARAREVALRFARLQKCWGPWGLAWWESLLRAADAQASRANDERTN